MCTGNIAIVENAIEILKSKSGLTSYNNSFTVHLYNYVDVTLCVPHEGTGSKTSDHYTLISSNSRKGY